MRLFLGPLVVLLVALGSIRCGDSPAGPSPAPTPTPTPTVPPVASLSSLRVTGETLLRAVGETTQLTATGTYTDGTTRNVTADAVWNSNALSRFRVSAGLVTVLEYGYGQVSASLGGRTSGLQVTATPVNTFIFSGRAREPGMSGLNGVRVFETASNRSVMTDINGSFQLAALGSTHSFKFDKDGYENIEVIAEMTSGPIIFLDAPMQPVIRLATGQAGINLYVAPHDVSYVFGSDPCYPCKLVRVTTPTAGTLRLTILQGSTVLRVWINGNRLTPSGTPLTVDAQVPSGEVPVYVGLNLPLTSGGTSNYVNFNLSASMVQ